MKGQISSDHKLLTGLFFRLLPFQVLLIVISAVNGIVDSLYASNMIGKEAMSAIGLFGPLNHFLYATSIMLVSGSQMLYDALNYSQQVTEAAASYRKNSASQSNEEFLSGFHKGDRLMPVITLTLCLSAEPWDAPTSLHEMLSISNERLLKFVPNYKLNLLTPAQISEEDFGKFRTGLGAVMQFAKHRNDQDVNWMAGNKRFEEMDRETADLIKTVTGADIRFDAKGDVVNMWAAWENGINQARNDGFSDGETKGRDSTMVNNIRNLMETSGWDAQQTMNALKIPASEQEKYARQIK